MPNYIVADDCAAYRVEADSPEVAAAFGARFQSVAGLRRGAVLTVFAEESGRQFVAQYERPDAEGDIGAEFVDLGRVLVRESGKE